jgi:hypothetical protein
VITNKDMKSEEQNIAIAKAYGWKPDDDGAGLNTWEASYVGNKLYGKQPQYNKENKIVSYIIGRIVPDYINDLNAMHEAEKILFPKFEIEWHNQLQNVCGGSWRIMLNSSAAQRAEAFLRTIGKWEDEQ